MYKIEVYRGTSPTIQAAFTLDGQPLDLTGYLGVLKAKRNLKDAIPAMEVDAELITDPAAGLLNFKPTPEDTDLAPGEYICNAIASKAPDDYYIAEFVMEILGVV